MSRPGALESETVREARRYVERAMGVLDTLDLGPLDYNVTTSADYLRTAAALLEQYQQECGRDR
jgi:hypothetical protein